MRATALPKTINRFAYGPFNGASLEKIVLPSGVTNLPGDMVSYCPLTEGLYIETENSEAFTMSRTCLSFIGNKVKIYVKTEEIKNKIIEATGFSTDRIIIYSGNN